MAELSVDERIKFIVDGFCKKDRRKGDDDIANLVVDRWEFDTANRRDRKAQIQQIRDLTKNYLQQQRQARLVPARLR